MQALDPAFNKYRVMLASVEKIADGCRWAEGPVYFGDARCLLWSDIPNNRIMRWDEETGCVSVYRKPSNNANGNTRDRQGRLVTCEHDARRVTRTDYDGSITVLADKFDGKLLNSPNDVVVKSDDSVWFTDPPFGILSNYEGHVASHRAVDPRARARRARPRARHGGPALAAAARRADHGGGGFQVDAGLMFGLVAPAATPAAIVTRLSEAAAVSVTTEPLRSRLVELGFVPIGSKPEELRGRIEAEIAKWSRIIEAGNIKPG